MEETRAAYEEKYRAQVEEWRAMIDKWSAQAKKADAEARIQLATRLDRIKSKQAIADARLQQLRSAGRDAWDDLRKGLDDAAGELSRAVEEAREEFS